MTTSPDGLCYQDTGSRGQQAQSKAVIKINHHVFVKFAFKSLLPRFTETWSFDLLRTFGRGECVGGSSKLLQPVRGIESWSHPLMP